MTGRRAQGSAPTRTRARKTRTQCGRKNSNVARTRTGSSISAPAQQSVCKERGRPVTGLLGDGLDHEVRAVADVRQGAHEHRAAADGPKDQRPIQPRGLVGDQ